MFLRNTFDVLCFVWMDLFDVLTSPPVADAHETLAKNTCQQTDIDFCVYTCHLLYLFINIYIQRWVLWRSTWSDFLLLCYGIFICVCVCIYIYINIWVCVCTHMCIYVCRYNMHICMSIYTLQAAYRFCDVGHVHIHVCTHLCMYIFVFVWNLYNYNYM